MMEIRREDEIEDMSMQIAGSNGFGHSIEFMSQAYLRNRYSEIDIEDENTNTSKDRPLPVFLKVEKDSIFEFTLSLSYL